LFINDLGLKYEHSLVIEINFTSKSALFKEEMEFGKHKNRQIPGTQLSSRLQKSSVALKFGTHFR
jgi:hypothetical protein